jgi:UDP-N-acetylmuramoyl-L-alanyl-D-glutamate--2,6-diaminopimelate ligase
LFHWPALKSAVVNVDDAFGSRLAASLDRSNVQVVRYGMGQGDIAAHRLDLSTRGLKLEIAASHWGEAQMSCPVIGAFNAANLLGTLGVLLCSDTILPDAVSALQRVEAVAGRLQWVREEGAPLVVVDYAHTPDALEKVLQTLSSLRDGGGRLHCVFGCGGDRDPGKRALMGEIATRLADRCVITSDNPRNEDPRAIIAAIASGAKGAYRIEPDRAAAIHDAIAHAQANDVVLIAGKGHETYQEISGKRFPFDDVNVVRLELSRYPRAKHV